MRFICSDSGYSFTARSRGWDVHIVPTVRAEHSISGSGKSAEYDINVIKVKDVIYFMRNGFLEYFMQGYLTRVRH